MPKSDIIDMDGVIYQGNSLIEGAREFVERLRAAGAKFLFLTNASSKTQADLKHKLAQMGIDVEEEHFYTSALATAAFLESQRPRGSAYVIGDRLDTDIEAGIESGMTTYLVLTGVTARADLGRYPYQPDRVFDSVAQIPVE